MTVTATLSRGSTRISFPVRDESGNPLVSRSLGKPSHGVVSDAPGVDPFPEQDNAAISETFRINTVLHNTDTAIELADMFKRHSQGNPIQLNIPLPEYGSDLDVFPALEQDQALTLEYPSKAGGRINVSMDLSRVSRVDGVDSGKQFPTPTASGNGPVELTDGNTTVSFGNGVALDREVGRPNIQVRPTYSQYPKITDHRKAAYDTLSLTVDTTSDPSSVVSDLATLVREQRGRSTLTCDFNGAFGLGAFTVIFDPSSTAIRHTRAGGRGDQTVPSLDLRVVRDR